MALLALPGSLQGPPYRLSEKSWFGGQPARSLARLGLAGLGWLGFGWLLLGFGLDSGLDLV